MNKDQKNKFTIEHFKISTAFLTGVIVPIFIVFLGSYFEKPIREKEINTKYIELAIGILKEKPEKNKENIRKWAIEIINKYSEVPLSKEAINELQTEILETKAISSSIVTDIQVK